SVTGKPFCPIAAIAAPETFRRLLSQTRTPPDCGICKGRSGGVSGTLTKGAGGRHHANIPGAENDPHGTSGPSLIAILAIQLVGHIAAYSADPVVIKAADIDLLPIRERDNFCRLIKPEAKNSLRRSMK